jgi:HEPN domain-containing protein
MAAIGEHDYRTGAKERLEDAYVLLRQEHLGGSIYMAGRAVEGILRAVIWKGDTDYPAGRKSLETGHNLRDMWRLVRNLGVLRDHELRDSISLNVQLISRLWSNNMRFLPTTKMKKIWYDVHEIRGRRTMKQAANEYYDTCAAVVKQCEALWQS